MSNKTGDHLTAHQRDRASSACAVLYKVVVRLCHAMCTLLPLCRKLKDIIGQVHVRLSHCGTKYMKKVSRNLFMANIMAWFFFALLGKVPLETVGMSALHILEWLHHGIYYHSASTTPVNSNLAYTLAPRAPSSSFFLFSVTLPRYATWQGTPHARAAGWCFSFPPFWQSARERVRDCV